MDEEIEIRLVSKNVSFFHLSKFEPAADLGGRGTVLGDVLLLQDEREHQMALLEQVYVWLERQSQGVHH